MTDQRPLKTYAAIVKSLALIIPLSSFQSAPQQGEHRSVAEMYNQNNLGAYCLFAGNFINFGFWEHPVQTGTISIDQRIESQKNLYRLVIKKLQVTEADKLLEVSCGLGVGSSLVMTEFNPKEIHGIDISQAQISRAKKINSEMLQKYPTRIFLNVGAAEAIPYCPESFEKIFSIEAAQHFENLERFVEEVNRVLKPGGSLAIATFFGTSNESHALLSTTIPTIRDGIDRARPIYEFEEILKRNGFTNIKTENIGKNVWHGFDQWVAQGDLSKSWTRNWYKCYQKGFIDYFLITADKPERSPFRDWILYD